MTDQTALSSWPGAAVSDSAKPLPVQVEAVATLARQTALAEALYDAHQMSGSSGTPSAYDVQRALEHLPTEPTVTLRGTAMSCQDVFDAYREASEAYRRALNAVYLYCNDVYRDSLYALQTATYQAEEAAR